MKKLLLVAVLAIVGVITGCQDAKFAYLVSIQISPGTPSVTAGATQQFAAQGTFSNGATRDLTSLVTWSSATPSVATIAAGGLATTLSQGASTIAASFTGPNGIVSNSTVLTVNAPTVTSIHVSPGTPSVPAGLTQQFTAQGTFSNGTTRDLTSQATWSSSTPSVATIAAGGLATTHSQGTSIISASFAGSSGAITGSATLTVTASTLVSLAIGDSTVSPPKSVTSATVAAGTSHQFLAYGTYTDGRQFNITSSVQWTAVSVNGTVATINAGGLATALIPGTATITAKDAASGLTQSAALVVTNATATAIAVTPSNQTIAPLTQVTYSAGAKFSDGTTQNISGNATWSSTDTSVAIVTGRVATGVSAGSTMIQAAFGGVTGSASLSVSGATLTSIAFTPPSAIGIAIGTAVFLNPIGTFSDGTQQNIRTEAVWSVTPSDGSIATVQEGLVTGVGAGSATVTVQLGTVTQTQTVNVQNVSSIAVTPAAPTIADGTTIQFHALATLADGTTQDVTTSSKWSTANPAAVTIISGPQLTGIASGIAPGNSTITAVFGSVSGQASLTVTNATLSSIAITPTAPQSISVGSTVQYKATATFSDSTTQDVTTLVTWTSSDPAVAVVSLSGIATTTGTGSTMIKATADINGSIASDDKALIVF